MNLIEEFESFSEDVIDSSISGKVFFCLQSFFTVAETKKMPLVYVLKVGRCGFRIYSPVGNFDIAKSNIS